MNEGSDVYSSLIDASKAFDSYIRQKTMCCMGYFLDRNTLYLKMELSKPGF